MRCQPEGAVEPLGEHAFGFRRLVSFFFFFKYLFWEYPSGAGGQTPAELKSTLGFECSREQPPPQRDGLGRGFLLLAGFSNWPLVTQT
jgi:hypothetical protein